MERAGLSTYKHIYEYSNLTYEAFDQYACRKPTDMQEHSFNMQAYWSNATYDTHQLILFDESSIFKLQIFDVTQILFNFFS